VRSCSLTNRAAAKTKPRSWCKSTASSAAAYYAPFGSLKEDLERRAREDDKIRPLLEAKAVAKVIVVPDKLVNFVVE